MKYTADEVRLLVLSIEGRAINVSERVELFAIARAYADRLEADERVVTDGRLSNEIRNFIEGMSVSVDVSTSDTDAGRRYFGTVTEVMDCADDKHGVTLLVQDAEPNFKAEKPVPILAIEALRDVDHVITQWRESGREPAYGQWLNLQDLIQAALAVWPTPPVQVTQVDASEKACEWFMREFTDLNPATACLVWNFALALGNKLADAEKKYGYTDGWRRSDWMDECRTKLMEHVRKGDPRDVAAYCAFLWYQGASTALTAEPVAQGEASTATDLVDEGLTYFAKAGDAGDKEYVRAIRAHIERLTHLAAHPRVPDEPFYAGDLFWPDDDGEMCANDMCQLVQDMADNGMIESGATIRIRRAKSLPFSDVVVTIEEDGTANYVAAPQPDAAKE
jgi:hypothetical protein